MELRDPAYAAFFSSFTGGPISSASTAAGIASASRPTRPSASSRKESCYPLPTTE